MGLGFRIQGLGFGVQGLGFRVQGLEFWGELVFAFYGLGGLAGFRTLGFRRSRVQGLWFVSLAIHKSQCPCFLSG